MNAPHLLAVAAQVERFAPLAAAVAAEGLRLGWLDVSAEASSPVPPALEQAAALGLLRAVAVGGGRAVSVKPLKGAPVLRDLLREHFRGCAAVLVTGDVAVETPRLEPIPGGGYRVMPPGEAARELAPEEIARRLRRPRPWS
ncbi:MAG TPA: hypothetical protein VHQ65_01545 [Thermoanaerobaculia bacterium]|nr:hypothetical protein [Thermoanaerobaculia bacterium]